MSDIHDKLSKCEFDIQNITMFISQSLEQLKCKMCEYQQLQKELFVQDGIEKANIYANFEG